MGSEGQIVEEERDSVQAEMVSHIRSQEREIVEGESQIVGKRSVFTLGSFGRSLSADSDIGFKQTWKKTSFDQNYEAVLTVFFLSLWLRVR